MALALQQAQAAQPATLAAMPALEQARAQPAMLALEQAQARAQPAMLAAEAGVSMAVPAARRTAAATAPYPTS